MTLIKLLSYIGIIALLITVATIYFKRSNNYFISFLQHFCGTLFIVSGFVKAVDPLGTSFKMEQYFTSFYYTFENTAFSFIAPIFPFFNNYVNVFSISTIVLEMVLGVMLVLGIKPKFTAWAFFLLMLFFTILTGFTYLTGYVPMEANFFEFGKWGEFATSNMRVSDCGCFGDFLVMAPKTSFLKDVFLLIPGLIFIIYTRLFHKLFNAGARLGLFIISIIGFLFYCLNFMYWNEPSVDFRPFKEGVNIREQKVKEQDAESKRPVSQVITPKDGGPVVTLSMDEYMKRFAEFPKDKFDILQVTGESTIAHSKISDFRITTATEAGDDFTDQILQDTGYSLMIINYKVTLDTEMKMVEVIDTIYAAEDSIKTMYDSTRTIASIKKTNEEVENTIFKQDWLDAYKGKILPLIIKAQSKKMAVNVVFGGLSVGQMNDAKAALNIDFPVYQGDETILKTVIRSNPGILLWKDGVIIKKWHINKAPDWAEIETYMK